MKFITFPALSTRSMLSTSSMLSTWAILGVLLLAGNLYAAEPTMADVSQMVQTGHLYEAETMMGEIIKAHPKSAKAHFVAAEIFAKEGRLAESKVELRRAEEISPNLSFAKPAAVASLKHRLGIEDEADLKGGTNWSFWIGAALVIGLIVMLFSFFARSRAAQNYNGYPANGGGAYAPQGYPQQGYPQQGGGMGSGIMGGLATGVAVGAGVVAGEMLMHKVLDGDNSERGRNGDAGSYGSNDYNAGGSDFGVDNSSSWDDSSSGSDSDWT